MFLAIFFAYPVGTLVGLGLGIGEAIPGLPPSSTPGDVLGDPGVRSVLWFTVWQAVVSTVLTVLIALPGAAVLARFRLPGRGLVKALVTVPFVLPTVVVGAAFLALIGPDGLLGVDLDRTVWAILAAHVFFNYAVVVRIVGSVWAQLDRRQEEAARVLGASRLTAFRRVTFPALRPAIAAASTVVFLFTFTSFGIVQILGGPSYATLEVEIYRRTVYDLDLSGAAVLSLLQFVAVAVLLAVDAALTGRQRAARLAEPSPRRPRGVGEWTFVGVNLVVLVGLLLTPLAVLVERSFATADGYGLAYWRALAHSDASSVPFSSAWYTSPAGMFCGTTPSFCMASPNTPPPMRIFRPLRSSTVLISLRYQPPIWVPVLPALAVLKLYLPKKSSSSLRPPP